MFPDGVTPPLLYPPSSQRPSSPPPLAATGCCSPVCHTDSSQPAPSAPNRTKPRPPKTTWGSLGLGCQNAPPTPSGSTSGCSSGKRHVDQQQATKSRNTCRLTAQPCWTRPPARTAAGSPTRDFTWKRTREQPPDQERGTGGRAASSSRSSSNSGGLSHLETPAVAGAGTVEGTGSRSRSSSSRRMRRCSRRYSRNGSESRKRRRRRGPNFRSTSSSCGASPTRSTPSNPPTWPGGSRR